MALTVLNLPTDIPWTRVCVTTDMVDPGPPGAPPPLWQSSLALYRYVPPADYQVYPGRRIIYYKLAATISNYQPKAEQVLGALDADRLSTGTLKDEDVKGRLAMSLPCTGAIVQVSVTPIEQGRALQDYPYFLDVQPRQRALYEQVTQSNERASRSLETLQLRKDGATSNSIEVLDIDQGGGVQAQIAGFGGGINQQGQWGTKSLGKDDTANITTNDASREARETQSFTTQLSQMYTLLQAYHLGTNRVFFQIVPRPHTIEKPNGFTAPRELDGVQDLFMVVSQAEGDALPCITARLDTGHLHVQPQMGFDRSEPPQTLTLDFSAPAPLEGDTQATGTQIGSSAFYGCFFKPVSKEVSLNAPTGYIIEKWTDLANTTSGRPEFITPTSVTLLPDNEQARTVVIRGTATGYACHRNEGGDIVNFGLHPSGGATNTDIWAETTGAQPGQITRSISVSFRSEVATKKEGDQYLLALTTRQLRCCDAVVVTPPAIIEFVPVLFVPALTVEQSPIPDQPRPPERESTVVARPTATGGLGMSRPVAAMNLAQVNELQQQLTATTLRLSRQITDVGNAPARDAEFVLQSLLASVVDDPRRARTFRADAKTLGLSEKEQKRLAANLGRTTDRVTRFDVLTMPEPLLRAATGRSGTELLRLRLAAAGLPTREPSAAAGPKAPVSPPRRQRRK